MSSLDRRIALMGLVSVILVLLSAGTAVAAGPCQGSGAIDDRGGEAAGTCPVSNKDRSAQPVSSGASRGGGGVACSEERAADPKAWWISYEVPDEAIPGDGERRSWHALSPPEGQTAAVYRDCNGVLRSMVFWAPEPVPGGADDDDAIFVARQEARARVEPATPVFAVSPEQAVVRFPTWLWLEESYWQPASATTSTPSGLSVTVEARPVEVRWDLDEGVQVCDGPGVAWSPAADAAYELQPESMRGTGNPACTFTFINASSTRTSGVFDASVTVVWEFSWALNGADRGVFGSVEVSESWALRVGEVQTVITG
jgi:hypothetical protein